MGAATVQPTAFAELDGQIAKVKEGSRTFARLSIDERLSLLEALRAGFRGVADEMARLSCEAKGTEVTSHLLGEEYIQGPLVVTRYLRLLHEALEDIKKHGAPRLEKRWFSTLADGRVAVRVYPMDTLESFLIVGQEVWVHMEKGMTEADVRARQAPFYRKPHEGRVCAVLGGGNVACIPQFDILGKMFVDGTACILKMNPVNAYLGPLIERAFATAISRGFLAVVYGGAEEGTHLAHHPAVDEVHMTGSDRTYDAMVWGPAGPEREARKKRNDPVLKKEFTSELGNISPVIVVPGPYTPSQLRFQAASIAGMIANNASFNCNSPKLLVVPKEWEHRKQLLDLIEATLRQVPPRKAYYPGAEERFKAFVDGRPNVRLIGQARAGELPWGLLPDVDPTRLDDRVFTQEPWCSLLSETALPGSDVSTFLDHAVSFVNANVWGTLCATLMVHPKTLDDPAFGPAVDRAVRTLEYGTVCLNTWPAAAFALGTPPWGGYPISTPTDIQSGRGWVHNTQMLEGIEKVVMRAPIRFLFAPLWSATHGGLADLGRLGIKFQDQPSWAHVPGLLKASLKA